MEKCIGLDGHVRSLVYVYFCIKDCPKFFISSKVWCFLAVDKNKDLFHFVMIDAVKLIAKFMKDQNETFPVSNFISDLNVTLTIFIGCICTDNTVNYCSHTNLETF